MDDLVRWLREQLDIDARENASPYAGTAWHARGCENLPDVLYPGRETGPCDCGVPTQVLREIEAKRALLDAVMSAQHDYRYWSGRPPADPERRLEVLSKMEARWSAWQFVATQLAAPYADRPGYAEAIGG
ncbi:DUF6221 family protein [Streptomyces sp. NPDC000888]